MDGEKGSAPGNAALKEGETLDDLLSDGLKIIQARGTYRFGSDSVRLARFAMPRNNDRVLDLGCGDGILPLLMWSCDKSLRFTGVEIRPDACDRALRSVEMNGLGDRIAILRGDVRNIADLTEKGAYDLCVCNPPYWGKDRFEDDGARTQRTFTWEDMFRAAAYALRGRGRLCAIIPAEKADEVLAAGFEKGFTPKRTQAVHARRDACAKRILLETVYGGRPGGVRVLPPLFTDGEG